MRVEPNLACATYSLMRGSGLSIATAGMTGTLCLAAQPCLVLFFTQPSARRVVCVAMHQPLQLVVMLDITCCHASVAAQQLCQ